MATRDEERQALGKRILLKALNCLAARALFHQALFSAKRTYLPSALFRQALMSTKRSAEYCGKMALACFADERLPSAVGVGWCRACHERPRPRP